MSGFPTADPAIDRAARRLTLTGRVQGIGLRPAVARWAAACDLAGAISNRREGVEITVEGSPDRLDQFVQGLRPQLPAAARVDSIRNEEVALSGFELFSIADGDESGPLQTQVPPDLAVCPDCLDEVSDRKNRRYQYPFTSCTSCGPRYSIVQGMPYERAATGMTRFKLCLACQAEYTNPSDRRFHAQTNACPECGPHVWCSDRDGRTVAHRGEALAVATKAILDGLIVAVRGVGGYQLVCDATNETSVSRLRERKHRAKKPLAVMVEDLAGAERLALIDGRSRAALTGPANPIVLCRHFLTMAWLRRFIQALIR